MAERLIWPITLVVCIVAGGLTAPGIIRAVKEPSVIVQPGPAPVVLDYPAQVKAACAKLTDEQRDYVLTQYQAMWATTLMPSQPKNDGDFQDKIETYRKAYYGDPYPFKEAMKPLHDLAFAEAERRGMIGKEWDREKWRQLAVDTISGVIRDAPKEGDKPSE